MTKNQFDYPYFQIYNFFLNNKDNILTLYGKLRFLYLQINGGKFAHLH